MPFTPKLTYKGKPLVRKDNELYYGRMTDPYVLRMQIQTTKNGLYNALDIGSIWLQKANENR